MKCKKVQDLLLTDYLDKEIEHSLQQEIHDHMRNCSACAEFGRTIQQEVSRPFQEVNEKIQPPAYVWTKIRNQIESEQTRQINGYFSKFKDLLTPFQIIPRPVYLFASMAVILLFVFTLSPQQSVKYTKEDVSEQIDYLVYLNESQETEIEDFEFGSVIEEYFM